MRVKAGAVRVNDGKRKYACTCYNDYSWGGGSDAGFRRRTERSKSSGLHGGLFNWTGDYTRSGRAVPTDPFTVNCTAHCGSSRCSDLVHALAAVLLPCPTSSSLGKPSPNLWNNASPGIPFGSPSFNLVGFVEFLTFTSVIIATIQLIMLVGIRWVGVRGCGALYYGPDLRIYASCVA